MNPWMFIIIGSVLVAIGSVMGTYGWYKLPKSEDSKLVTKIDDIHAIVEDMDQNVRQLGSDLVGVQAGSKTQIQFDEIGLIKVKSGVVPEEMQLDFQAGKQFYERYLDTEFPQLPERFFLRILSVRANPREARAVVIDLLAERKLLGVFWAYKGYGSVHHSRSYDPPRYIFSVAPLLSKKAMKIYLMDSEPFDIPEVGVEEWIR